MEHQLDVVQRDWDRREDEPEVWYTIFRDYYLPLGVQRTLRSAFEFYIRVEKPKQYQQVDPDRLGTIPNHWNEFAVKYEWARRAMAYDQDKTLDLRAAHVNQVLQYLQSNALVAAEALVRALQNDRTRVQAANAILNRAGVPEVSEINLRTGVVITSDDMAAASNKVDEWMTSKKLSG